MPCLSKSQYKYLTILFFYLLLAITSFANETNKYNKRIIHLPIAVSYKISYSDVSFNSNTSFNTGLNFNDWRLDWYRQAIFMLDFFVADLVIAQREIGKNYYHASNSIVFEVDNTTEFETENGAEFTAEILSDAPTPTSNDLNWMSSKTFDENGNITSEDIQYLDKNGRPLQSQTKFKHRENPSTVNTHVFATQPIRDVFGRNAAITLPAPINSSEFSYKHDFVQNMDGTPYNYQNFDQYNPAGLATDKTNNPEAIGKKEIPGTLGWYYSVNNTLEPYTPTTDYPFSRTSFYNDGTGNAKKAAGPGEVFKMGSGHENSSYVTPVVGQLEHYIQVRNKFFPGAEIGETPSAANLQAIQSVSKNADGKQGITILDKDNHTLMNALPGNELTTFNTVQFKTSYIYEYDVSIPGQTVNTRSSISGAGNITVYQYQGLVASIVYQGTVSGYADPLLGSKIRIESDAYFNVSYWVYPPIDDAYQPCINCPATIIEPDSKIHYFKLFEESSVGMIGSGWKLYNMGDNEQEISLTTTLPAGYYKFEYTGPSPVTISYSNKYRDISYKYYNQKGQLVATIAPEGVKKLLGTGINDYTTKNDIPFITLYYYDVQGRLTKKTTPDGGTGEIVYRADGKIRFSQNAQQKIIGRYSYTNYDAFSRPIESGEYEPDINGIPFNSDLTTNNPMKSILDNTTPTGGLTTGIKRDVVIVTYDIVDNSHGLTTYLQNPLYLGNTVSSTKKYNKITNNVPSAIDLTSATWYNLDEEGNITWIIQYIAGLGYKTMDYTYDITGRLVKKIFQKNTTEAFVHYFEYDAENKKLWKVYTNTIDEITSRQLQATYIYYIHGPLKRIELATNLQGLDYTYTLQGKLKAINNSNKLSDPGQDGITGPNAGFIPDAFGFSIDYHNNDYINERNGIQSIININTNGTIAQENYSGNINALSWHSKKPSTVVSSIPGIENPNTYIYKYDDKQQLIESEWGTPNFSSNPASFSTTANNKESIKHPNTEDPAYDANGNIQYLQRTNENGTLIDKFAYTYNTNSNKIQTIVNSANGSSSTYATYTYNLIGQLIAENATDPLKAQYIEYDVSGKVISIFRDALHTQKIVEYIYNERGQRIIKKLYNASFQLIQVTYYSGGNVFNQSFTNSGNTPGNITADEYKISGGDFRIGIFYRQSNVYAYELNDHQGNVRAVVARSGTNYEIRAYSDYYPFGMVIRRGGADHRYGYQGQFSEKDGETDWNAFELRMYNSRIARWLTTDPNGQFWSPYVGMGNNPVNGVDPNGGTFFDWLKAKYFAMTHNGNISYEQRQNNGNYYYAVQYGIEGGIGMKYFKDNGGGKGLKLALLAANNFNIMPLSPNSGNLLYSDLAQRTIELYHGEAENILKRNVSTLTNIMWKDMPDMIEISLTHGVSSGVSVSGQHTITLLLKGKDPGIYYSFTPQGGIETSIDVNAGLTFGVGTYLGDVHEMTSDVISGWNTSITGELGVKLLLEGAAIGELEMGYDEAGKPNTVMLKIGAQFGFGIGSPVGAQIMGGNTQEPVKLW